MTLTANGRTFRSERDMINVTSINRPDPSWRFTDANGHLHQWYVNGQPATEYRLIGTYTVPTVYWIVDVPATDEYPEMGHHECILCNQRVRPGSCADAYEQFIPGMRYYYIDDMPVSEQEFRRQLTDATGHQF